MKLQSLGEILTGDVSLKVRYANICTTAASTKIIMQFHHVKQHKRINNIKAIVKEFLCRHTALINSIISFGQIEHFLALYNTKRFCVKLTVTCHIT